MIAMVLERHGQPLIRKELADPVPGGGQVLLRVAVCAVCRTDLHLVDGELPGIALPLIPGHEIVGTVIAAGPGVDRWSTGDRLGIGWLGWTCGECEACRSGLENLCARARFTGHQIPGGYATLTVADQRYCYALPSAFTDLHAAPLLCAGIIGYRSLKAAGEGPRLGLYGFGAAAHLLLQVARHQGRRVFAFTRPGDSATQQFARQWGASWSGDSDQLPPEPLDAAILFAPVGSLVPTALAAVRKGGRVVCAGIHMSDIPAFPYELLWGERSVASVANLTRRDAEEFLQLATEAAISTETREFPLAEANQALGSLRRGEIRGAAVLNVAASR
jgi:propanol-preferring alcohol dehydrogenase